MLLLGTFAFGHHSFTAEYDQKKPVKLTGNGQADRQGH